MTTDLETDSTAEKEVFVPDLVLQDFGCVNCVWKQHGQCPEGFTLPDQSVPGGYCARLGSFLVSLRATSGSLSQMKEKFFLYTQELQAMSDKTKFTELQRKYDELSRTRPKSGEEAKRFRTELASLGMAITEYRLWWSRLTEAIIKGLGRIGDREERKAEDLSRAPERITIQQFNLLLKSASDERPALTEK